MSKCDENNTEIEYDKLNFSKYNLIEIYKEITSSASEKNNENGITDKFNDSLISFLQGISDNSYRFF